MFSNMLRYVNPFRKKSSHMLFCIPRNDDAMGALPQFFALPTETSGVVYYADPEHVLFGLTQDDIISWFKKKANQQTLQFNTFHGTAEYFKKIFGGKLGKDYGAFEVDELADFGFGNFGFCMGPVCLSVDDKTTRFRLL